MCIMDLYFTVPDLKTVHAKHTEVVGYDFTGHSCTSTCNDSGRYSVGRSTIIFWSCESKSLVPIVDCKLLTKIMLSW